MDAEEVMKLFDFYWFEHKIITNSPSIPSLTILNLEISKESKKPEISRLQSRHIRSLSDHQLCSQTSLESESPSPKSVLTQYKHLQTILSGKEVHEIQVLPKKIEVIEKKPKVGKNRRKRGSSKSLSDLEFEELKGFMDLGFVFSEEDKNSSLVSIIPGLQRLGEKKHEEEEEEEEENEEEENESGVDEKKDVMVVSRPYLSEAWEFMDDRKEEKAPFMMMNWRFPSLSNEIDMKDHLRSWAHSVASAVR